MPPGFDVTVPEPFPDGAMVRVAVGSFTVMLTDPLFPLNVPVMVAVPAPTAVTVPWTLTVATAELLVETLSSVTVAVELSL